jgi:amino acid transporter
MNSQFGSKPSFKIVITILAVLIILAIIITCLFLLHHKNSITQESFTTNELTNKGYTDLWISSLKG